MLLDRSVPPLKQQANARPFKIGDAKELSDIGRAIIAAIASGDLPPDTGRELIDGLAAQCKLIEVDEIVRRLEGLEKEASSGKPGRAIPRGAQ